MRTAGGGLQTNWLLTTALQYLSDIDPDAITKPAQLRARS
jgi:hypothetical protein